MPKSKCCKSPVTVRGKHKSGCTNWYECDKCGEACDVTTKPKEPWMAHAKKEWSGQPTKPKKKVAEPYKVILPEGCGLPKIMRENGRWIVLTERPTTESIIVATDMPKKKVREWTAWMVVFGNKMYRVCISKGNANQWAKVWRSLGAKVIKVKITEVGGRRKGR